MLSFFCVEEDMLRRTTHGTRSVSLSVPEKQRRGSMNMSNTDKSQNKRTIKKIKGYVVRKAVNIQ